MTLCNLKTRLNRLSKTMAPAKQQPAVFMFYKQQDGSLKDAATGEVIPSDTKFPEPLLVVVYQTDDSITAQA